MDERYYTVAQIAKLFQVTRAGVYKWMRSGQLRYVIVGSDRRIPATAVREFVKECGPPEPELAEAV